MAAAKRKKPPQMPKETVAKAVAFFDKPKRVPRRSASAIGDERAARAILPPAPRKRGVPQMRPETIRAAEDTMKKARSGSAAFNNMHPRGPGGKFRAK